MEERLEFREEQVQCLRKGGMEEEQHVLTALAILGEVILYQRQKKPKENKDAGRITEGSVLKINETGGKSVHFIERLAKFQKRRKKGMRTKGKKRKKNGGKWGKFSR